MKKLIIPIIFIIFLSLSIVSAENIDVTNCTVYLDKNIEVNESTVIDKEVIIVSNNSSIIAKNCNVFNITEKGKLTLVNLIISNGKTAIYNNGSLYLLNCTIINNKGVDGGAVYSNGKLTIVNSTFSNNIISHYGGAIFNSGDNMTIENSIFIANTAKHKKQAVGGGAIFNSGKNLKVTNCFFDKNGCSNTDWYQNEIMYGGALFNKGDNLTVLNTIFTRNYLFGSTDTTQWHLDLKEKYGGAVFTSGTGLFINNTFDFNEIYSYLASYVVKKIDCSHRGYGGGIYSSSTVQVINNTFINNRAGQAPLHIHGHNSLIDGNLFVNNTVMHGSPALHIGAKNTTILNNVFLRNYVLTDTNMISTTAYGSIRINDGENEVIMNNYFENCSGIDYYNVYHNDNGEYVYHPVNAVIKNNIFKHSSEAIFLDAGVNMTIEGNQFYDCHTGITGDTSKDIIIKNNLFTGEFEEATHNHGTFHSSAPFSIELHGENNVVADNVFTGLYGKGTILTVSGGLSGKNNVITGNYFINNSIINNYTVVQYDGNVYTVMSNAIIQAAFLEDSTISNNYFENNDMHGGSLMNLEAFSGSITDNVFNSDETVFIFQNYYKHNIILFKNNKVLDRNTYKEISVYDVLNGTSQKYDYQDFKSTVIRESGNSKYNGNGSEFNEKIKDLIDFILNGLKAPLNSTDNIDPLPDNSTDVENNENPNSNSTSNTDKTTGVDDSVVDNNDTDLNEDLKDSTVDNNVTNPDKIDDNSNSTHNSESLHDVDGSVGKNETNKTSINSNVGDSIEILVKDINEVANAIEEVAEGASISQELISRSVGIDNPQQPTQDSKSYEINKNIAKNVNDDSIYLKTVLVLLVVLVLLCVGYYRKK